MERQIGRAQFLILWAASATSVVLFFVVTRFAPPPEGVRDNPVLLAALLAAAAGLTAASFLIRNRIGADAPPQRRLTAMTIALAMCEAAAIFGLVVHFTAGSELYWVFLLIGLAGILLHFPREAA